MIDTTFLQEHEIEVVKKVLEEDEIVPFKDNVLIKIYEVPEKTHGGIYLPDRTKDNAKYNAVVGMVLKLGPDCFKTGPFKDSNEKGCEVGRWAVFSYKNPDKIDFNGVSFAFVYDDALKGFVKNPSKITRG